MPNESFETLVAADPAEQVDAEINSKFAETLKSVNDEAKSVADSYNESWRTLREGIKKAEAEKDEKRVLELEGQIYEVERQKAMYLAQLASIPKEGEQVRSEEEAEEKVEASDQLIEETDSIVRRQAPKAFIRYLDELGRSPVLELRQSAGRKLRRAAIIALTLLGTGVAKPAQSQGPEGKPAVTAEAVPAKMSKEFEQKKTSPLNITNWGFHFNAMLEKDPDSKKIFKVSPQAAIFPVNLEVTRFTTEEGKANADIPYEYARQFDLSPEARRNLNPGDYEKMTQSVKDDLSRRLVDQISGLSSQVWGEEGIAERRTRGIHGPEEAHQLKVKSIIIVGHASPEGHAARGVQTIRQGVIDAENIKLAAARASGGTEVLRQILKEKGISNEEFEKLVSSSAVEDQFSDQEMVDLASLAANEKGAADDEKIFNLVKKYNTGKIEDQAVKSKLDEIIGSKRRVTFEIEYENSSASRYAIPLPLLLLLLPSLARLAFRRKKRGEDDIKRPKPFIIIDNFPRKPKKPEPEPEEIIEEPTKPEITIKDYVVPQLIEETIIWEEDSDEYRRNQLEAYSNDLWVFFDEENAVRKGLDYRAICNEMLARYEDFKGDDPAKTRENFLAYTLLSVWRDHDLISRQEALWSKETINEGLDYENNPQQIKWAKIHARSLLKLVDEKRTNPSMDYLEILENRTKNLLKESFSKVLVEKKEGKSYRKV